MYMYAGLFECIRFHCSVCEQYTTQYIHLVAGYTQAYIYIIIYKGYGAKQLKNIFHSNTNPQYCTCMALKIFVKGELHH